MSDTILQDNTSNVNTNRRAALYIRVSTDEQARHGYSLTAQRETLDGYARQHGYAVTDHYIDDGVSAHQVYTRRPALMRLLSDVEAGRVDTILFIKLDRWFRNIKEYYKVQEILDRHGVKWRACLEDYETETSQGVLMVNFMLTIAQAESDRTSERIKFVFSSKVARGEVICGKTPIGYKIEDHHLVPDDRAEAVRDVFDHYLHGGSVRGTLVYARNTYSMPLHGDSFRDMLRNPIYVGKYRDNLSYCEPIVDRAVFDAVQARLASRSIRSNPSGRIYIFSGILICGDCGMHFTACYDNRSDIISYRCPGRVTYHKCPHSKRVFEHILEDTMLKRIVPAIDAAATEYEISISKRARAKATIDKAAISKRLAKLKELYLADLITLDEYRADHDVLKAQLDAAAAEDTTPKPDFDRLRALLAGDFSTAYAALDREHRRQFWHSIIDRIVLDVDNTPNIFFKL